MAAFEALIDPVTRGDPMSLLRWTRKSIRALTAALRKTGHQVSDFVVRRLLRKRGYRLQANVKSAEGGQHQDRDAQLVYLNDQAQNHLGTGDPVIFVDAKKKELIEAYQNGGQERHPCGQPEPVTVQRLPRPGPGHDQPVRGLRPRRQHRLGLGRHRPRHRGVRGAYHGHLVGQVGSVRRPGATRLLICADGGGSNGYRTRAWKTELAAPAASTGLRITVCHLPPGTSTWNQIEHRPFSHISMNWRGRPLTSHEVIVATIAATTTGLAVHAELDQPATRSPSPRPSR